jgi:hypothetical protein
VHDAIPAENQIVRLGHLLDQVEPNEPPLFGREQPVVLIDDTLDDVRR